MTSGSATQRRSNVNPNTRLDRVSCRKRARVRPFKTHARTGKHPEMSTVTEFNRLCGICLANVESTCRKYGRPDLAAYFLDARKKFVAGQFLDSGGMHRLFVTRVTEDVKKMIRNKDDVALAADPSLRAPELIDDAAIYDMKLLWAELSPADKQAVWDALIDVLRCVDNIAAAAATKPARKFFGIGV